MAKTLAEKIAVMQAAERGEEIETKFQEDKGFGIKVNNPLWDWYNNDYRVKPKPQKFWVVFNKKGCVMCSGAGTKPKQLLSEQPEWVIEEYERKV